jgi:hypothetical protein
MRYLGADATDRRRDDDELDSEFLAKLEQQDQQLYAILSNTSRYRNVLHDEIMQLRAGSAPGPARAQLATWDRLRWEIKRLAETL